jgi:hypothetical protein
MYTSGSVEKIVAPLIHKIAILFENKKLMIFTGTVSRMK